MERLGTALHKLGYSDTYILPCTCVTAASLCPGSELPQLPSKKHVVPKHPYCRSRLCEGPHPSWNHGRQLHQVQHGPQALQCACLQHRPGHCSNLPSNLTRTCLLHSPDDVPCLTPTHPQQCSLSRPPISLPIKLLNSLSQYFSEYIKCQFKENSSINKPLLVEHYKYAFISVSWLAQWKKIATLPLDIS